MPTVLIIPILKGLSLFLLALIPFFIDNVYNIIIDLINYLLVALVPAVVAVIGLFPANPCGSLIASCSEATTSLSTPDASLLSIALQTLNWLLPVAFLTNLVACVMLSVVIFFSMAPVARWLKLLN